MVSAITGSTSSPGVTEPRSPPARASGCARGERGHDFTSRRREAEQRQAQEKDQVIPAGRDVMHAESEEAQALPPSVAGPGCRLLRDTGASGSAKPVVSDPAATTARGRATRTLRSARWAGPPRRRA